MRVGILALQGAFREHANMIRRLGEDVILVKTEDGLFNSDALIIPGGESTTISHLLHEYGLYSSILDFANSNKPIFGTCAGSILLSKNPGSKKVKPLGVLDISIKRNGYGTQKDSFEIPLQIKGIGEFQGIFIRAPIITSFHNGVEVLCEANNNPVMVKSGNILATTFHPELTNCTKVHELFLSMAH